MGWPNGPLGVASERRCVAATHRWDGAALQLSGGWPEARAIRYTGGEALHFVAGMLRYRVYTPIMQSDGDCVGEMAVHLINWRLIMARFVKTSFDASTQQITWTVAGQFPVVLDLGRVSEANKQRAMVHGFIQRCSDNAADEKTAEGKAKAIREMVEFYGAGGAEWERTRVGGGVKFDSGAVITAMARALFGGNVDRANHAADAVAGKRAISRDEALKLFAADERVAGEIARAKAAKAKMNADDLLGEIGGEEEPSEEPSDDEGALAH